MNTLTSPSASFPQLATRPSPSCSSWSPCSARRRRTSRRSSVPICFPLGWRTLLPPRSRRPLRARRRDRSDGRSWRTCNGEGGGRKWRPVKETKGFPNKYIKNIFKRTGAREVYESCLVRYVGMLSVMCPTMFPMEGRFEPKPPPTGPVAPSPPPPPPGLRRRISC